MSSSFAPDPLSPRPVTSRPGADPGPRRRGEHHPAPRAARVEGPLPFLATTARFALAATVLGATGLQGAAFAQAEATSSNAGQAAVGQVVRHYAIPAGPLAEVLQRFTAESGLTLLGSRDQVEGVRSPGVSGDLDARAALTALLSGTGLDAVASPDGSYRLTPRAAATAGAAGAGGSGGSGGASSSGGAGAAATLPTVTVVGNLLGEITEGSGTYAPGTFATGTRLVLTQRESPQSVSVVTRQEMEDFNLTSIDDVLAHTPGVSIITFDSERTVAQARGFAINSYQYDGVPVMRNSAYSAGQSLTDMIAYDRIEVLKGATGLLTGVGDPGATINLVRKKPTRDLKGELTAGIGRWNDYRVSADVGSALNESGSIRGRVAAAYQDRESHLDYYRRKSTALYGIVEADLTPSTLLSVGAEYQNSDPRGSTWGGIPIYDANGNFNRRPISFNNGARWTRWEQYTHAAFATVEHAFQNEWIGKVQLNRQVNGYDAQLLAAASGNPDPATGTGVGLWGPGWFKGKTVSNSLDVYGTGPFNLLGRRHELVLGANVTRTKWSNDSWNDPTFASEVPNYYAWDGVTAAPNWAYNQYDSETTRQTGLYATARLNVRDDLKVILGSRLSNYRNEDVRKNGMVVPYLGAVYDVNNWLSAYASYTTIFKPQSARDVQGNTLDPLEGKNYELGLKGDLFGGRLQGSLAYFELVQDNFAQALVGQVGPAGELAYEAIQGVKTKGFEVEVSGSLTPRWQLHGGFTHRISRQDGEKVETLVPENVFSLYTTYRPELVEGLTVGGGARWQSKTWGTVYQNQVDVEASTKSLWLVDLMARYEFDKRTALRLGINNVLDKRYYTMFTWYSTYTWGQPRNVNLTLSYKF